MSGKVRLSEKSERILSMIAEGHSYAQIVDSDPAISYLDIFSAADEAIRLLRPESDYQDRMMKIRTSHPNAYAPWSEVEDAELARLHLERKSISSIAARFGRQPSAIRSRLAKLGFKPSG